MYIYIFYSYLTLSLQGHPKIPVQPIGYDDAKILLSKLAGPVAPDEWQGGIEGMQYRIGGEMLPEFKGWKVKMKVRQRGKLSIDERVLLFVTTCRSIITKTLFAAGT
jgi:hypothetical protein